MSKISVLGAGGWGLALSLCFRRKGHSVTVWTPFEDELNTLKTQRESKLLSGVKIPDDILFTSDISCVEGSSFTVIATPSTAVRETAKRLKGINFGIIVSVAKGIDYESTSRLSEIITNELCGCTVVVLSGPSHAEEVAREIETSLVASSLDEKSAKALQKSLADEKMRIYTNPDVIGAELGGAFKNIIAIASGICTGLGLGDNTRAALITRGLAETARLGIAMGAHEQTFHGLTGLGDLIVTCTSMHSRNNRFGILLGRGTDLKTALKEIGTVEGYFAVRTAHKLSQIYKIDMPIVEECYKIMYEGLKVDDAKKALMTRKNRPETERLWE